MDEKVVLSGSITQGRPESMESTGLPTADQYLPPNELLTGGLGRSLTGGELATPDRKPGRNGRIGTVFHQSERSPRQRLLTANRA